MGISLKKPGSIIKLKKILAKDMTNVWNRRFQAEILSYMAEMLQEGFSMLEILAFMEIVYVKQQDIFVTIANNLRLGNHFCETVSLMHIEADVAFQIEIAEKHTEFAKNLGYIARYLAAKDHQRRMLYKILLYPLTLLLLVVLLMFGIRMFMLPQLKAMQLGMINGQLKSVIYLLTYFPHILVVLSSCLLFGYFYLKSWQRRTPIIKKMRFYTQLPLIGRLFRLYYTYYFANECSQLLQVGYSLQQVIQTFEQQKTIIFLQGVGDYLQTSFLQGEPFSESLHHLDCFTYELPAIIQQGELLHQLAIKMRLYAQRCLESFYNVAKKYTAILKNILFVWVALTIVMVYLILMLPMLSMIGGI